MHFNYFNLLIGFRKYTTIESKGIKNKILSLEIAFLYLVHFSYSVIIYHAFNNVTVNPLGKS